MKRLTTLAIAVVMVMAVPLVSLAGNGDYGNNNGEHRYQHSAQCDQYRDHQNCYKDRQDNEGHWYWGDQDDHGYHGNTNGHGNHGHGGRR